MEGRAWLPIVSVHRLEFSYALQEVRQNDTCFHARQGSPEAEVYAVSKGQVWIRLTPDVEMIGIGEVRGISIGGSDHCEHPLSAPECYGRSSRPPAVWPET